jgi:hypothetical protein
MSDLDDLRRELRNEKAWMQQALRHIEEAFVEVAQGISLSSTAKNENEGAKQMNVNTIYDILQNLRAAKILYGRSASDAPEIEK